MTATISASVSGRPDRFYRELSDQHLGALWNVLSNTLTREPAVRSVPQLWRWSDLRPRMLHSGELVTAAEAERRVLYLLNPGLAPEQIKIVGNLYAGVQLLLPGEIARTHNHTPSAQPQAPNCVSRAKTNSHFGKWRTGISDEVVHRFRSMANSRFG